MLFRAGDGTVQGLLRIYYLSERAPECLCTYLTLYDCFDSVLYLFVIDKSHGDSAGQMVDYNRGAQVCQFILMI